MHSCDNGSKWVEEGSGGERDEGEKESSRKVRPSFLSFFLALDQRQPSPTQPGAPRQANSWASS